MTRKITLEKNGFNQKMIQGMLNILYILNEKSRVLAGGGSAPPRTCPLRSQIFYALPKTGFYGPLLRGKNIDQRSAIETNTKKPLTIWRSTFSVLELIARGPG